MIMTMALYALVVSSVIGVIALLVERGAAMRRWPVRWSWLAAMGAMVVVPLATTAWSYARPLHRVEVLPVDTTSVLGAKAPPDIDVASSGAVVPASTPMRTEAISPLERWKAALMSLAERTAGWDRTLAVAWLILSMSLLVRVVREVRHVHRLPQTLPLRSIAGTSVRVSEAVGPAAIGGRTPSVVLPAWVLEMDEKLVDLVVQHEREHLDAGDTRLLMLGLAWLVLMPWQLPLWWAWHRLRLAIELDCDARVLRRGATPRSYAQLLLLITQRRGNMRLDESLAGPLLLAFNPQRHHLEKRISAMTARSRKNPVRLVLVGTAIAATATLAAAIPAPPVVKNEVRANPSSSAETRVGALPAILRVHKLGLSLAEIPGNTARAMEIVIYGNGTVRLGIGTAVLTDLSDTVRLDHLPAFSADVTNGEVHVEIRRVGGTLELAGDATGAAMKSFSVKGRHVVLEKGGAGVRAVLTKSADGSDTRPQARRTQPVSERELRLADSVAARTSALELTRVKLVTRYSPEFPSTRVVDAKLAALADVTEGLSAPAKRRVRDAVIRSLDERHAGLGLERQQLLVTYDASSPTVTDVTKEQVAIEARRRELDALSGRR
jgi:beta-lactamase regulating signal transducer with metallopeptidase domain